MKYMLLIYVDDQALSDTERNECYLESAQFAQQIKASGHYLGASPLYPVSMATSLRVRNEEPIITNGPFAETREQLGGYFVIEAGDLDEAMGIAQRIPMASLGTIEIRPMLEIAGLPSDLDTGRAGRIKHLNKCDVIAHIERS